MQCKDCHAENAEQACNVCEAAICSGCFGNPVYSMRCVECADRADAARARRMADQKRARWEGSTYDPAPRTEELADALAAVDNALELCERVGSSSFVASASQERKRLLWEMKANHDLHGD